MYLDWNGNEQEDLEGENMQRDEREQQKEHRGPVLLIHPCSEQQQHGDCYDVENKDEVVLSHVPYTTAYKRVYGVEPSPFDPSLEID